MKKKNLLNVAIFAKGKFKGKDYTDADLQAIVDAHKLVNYSPKLKITHKRKEAHGQSAIKNYPFSFGKIKNIRKENNLLKADLHEVPEKVVDLIESGLLSGKSIELGHDLQLQSGVKVPNFITHLSLLGYECPALFEFDEVAENFTLVDDDPEEIEVNCSNKSNYDLNSEVTMPNTVGEVDTDGAGTPSVNSTNTTGDAKKPDPPVAKDVNVDTKTSTPFSLSADDLNLIVSKVAETLKPAQTQTQTDFSLIKKKQDDLDNKYKQLAISKSKELDTVFIKGLIESKEPQLRSSDLDTVKSFFSLLPDDEELTVPNKSEFHLSKIDPSQTDFSSDEVVSTKDLVKRLLAKILPKRTDFSLEEIALDEEDLEGIEITNHELKNDFGGDLDSAKLHKKALKIAKEKNIDFNSTEGFKQAYALASSGGK